MNHRTIKHRFNPRNFHFSSVTSLSNRKNHGSISSTDSGHSEAMSYCEGNVYHLTSSILHNAPNAAPLPPRRHSAVQQGSNSTNIYHPQVIQPNIVNSSAHANGDISSMPPPPNPRTRTVPFPIAVPVLPGANVTGYNLYATQQQPQFNQLRHAGKSNRRSYELEKDF